MLRSLLLLPLPFLVALTALAGASHAQSCAGVTPNVRSYSTATAGPPTASGPFTGHPAITSISNGVAQLGFNVIAVGALTIDNAYFLTSARVGGEMNVSGTTSNSGVARTMGDVYDCLQIEGYAGSGRLHVPLHLTADNTISSSVGGNYQGNAGAGAAFVVACMAYVGQGPLLDCPVTQFTFSTSEHIDTTIELVFPFTFGTPTAFQFGPRLTSSLGYAANGSEGQLLGTANVDLQGALEPAYVDDGFGTLLPNATITAGSGFDYLHPAPEPGGAAAAGAAIAALAAPRRRNGRDSALLDGRAHGSAKIHDVSDPVSECLVGQTVHGALQSARGTVLRRAHLRRAGRPCACPGS